MNESKRKDSSIKVQCPECYSENIMTFVDNNFCECKDCHKLFNKTLNYEENLKIYEKIDLINTQQKIDLLFDNFKDFLKEKNLRYGDSALNPKQIFSKVAATDQICNRLDDKLGRIEKSSELKKNDISDVFGYIALLLISNDWLEFNDLLD